MNDGYVELILQRIATVADHQGRQIDKVNELRRDVASLLVLMKRIDTRLEKIENRAAR